MQQLPNSIAIGIGKTFSIWNVQGDDDNATEQVRLPVLENVVGIAWNHNGEVLAACHNRNTQDSCHGTNMSISLISVRSGRIISEIVNDKLSGCKSLNFAGRTRLLCCSCSVNGREIDNSLTRHKVLGDYVSVWDLKQNIEARRFDVFGSEHLIASGLDASNTYVFILTSTTFTIWLFKESEQIAKLECNKSTSFTCYDTITTPEKQCLIAIGDGLGTVRIYDLKDFIAKGKSGDIDAAPLRPIAKFTFDGRSNTSRKNTATTDSIPVTTGKDFSKCMQLIFSDVVIGMLTSDRLIVYNWLNQVIVGDIRLNTLHPDITATSFAWNGATVAFAFSSSKEVLLMDWKTRRLLAKFEDNQCEQNFSSSPGFIAFSPITIERQQVLSVHKGSFNKASCRSDSDLENPIHISTTESNLAIHGLLPHPSVSMNDAKDTQLNIRSHALTEEKKYEAIRDSTLGNATSTNFYSEFAYTNSEEEKKQSGIPSDINSSDNRLVYLIREEVKEAIACLHCDMIRQFRIQSEEVNKSLSKQLDVMDRMADENQRLRLENQRLRHFLRQDESSL